MKDLYYAILMDKKVISENVVVYFPERVISGILEKQSNENQETYDIFIENGYEKEYILMTNLENFYSTDCKVVGYPILERDLLKQSYGLSIENAKLEYFDTVSEKLNIGFYFPEEYLDKVFIAKLDLEELKMGLINSCGQIDNFDFTNLSIAYSTMFTDKEESKEIKKETNSYSESYFDEGYDEIEKLIYKLELLSPDNICNSNNIDRIRKKVALTIKTCESINNLLENSYEYSKEKTKISTFLSIVIDYYQEHDMFRFESDIDKINLLLSDFSFMYNKELSISKQMYQKLKEKKTFLDLDNVSLSKEKTKKNVPFSLKEIKEYCNKRIIGQEKAKEAVISAIYMNRLKGNHLNKTTCLLVGPTGSGKTLIAETVAECLNIPSVSIDTTQLTIAGYKGADIENYLSTLIEKANGDVEKAEHGIVIFDEFDKKGSSKNDDPSGKGVLNSLLPFIQGTMYKVEYNKKNIDFNTHNLTVLIAGSCADAIDAIYEKENKVLGFKDSSKKEGKEQKHCVLTKEDIEKYCNIPKEFMGRIKSFVQLEPHTKESMKQILLFSDISPLLSECEKLKQVDVSLCWNDEYIEKVVEKALKDEHGVRALSEIIENSIVSARWETLYDDSIFNGIVLNEKSVDNSEDAILVYKDGNYITVKEYKEKEMMKNNNKVKKK